MKAPLILTEDQRSTLTNALQVAAERYDEHVTTCGTAAPDTGLGRLKAQFVGQSIAARIMRDLIENADTITLDGTR